MGRERFADGQFPGLAITHLLCYLFSLQAPAVIGGVFGPVAQPDGATVS